MRYISGPLAYALDMIRAIAKGHRRILEGQQSGIETPSERERRTLVEREEDFLDAQERYVEQFNSAQNPGARQSISEELGELRRRHREETLPDSPAGAAIALMQEVLWDRWIRIAVKAELGARSDHRRIVADPESDAISSELDNSLTCMTACAHAVEGLYGEIKYLIPAPTSQRDRDRDRRVSRAFNLAFGNTPSDFRERIEWLFDKRDFAVHPFSMFEPVEAHPLGLMSSSTAAAFNAVECQRAVDLTMELLELAEDPPAPHSHRVTRWAGSRRLYHDRVDELRLARNADPFP
jgi:hypothetical protein